jgi:HlyD family secretion protein
MKKLLWIILIIVVLLGGFALFGPKKAETTAVTVAKATQGDITSIVTATGKIFPEIEVKISSEVAGEIVELPVNDGDEVKRGDVLVRVNPDTLEAQVSQQEAALAASRANSAEATAQLAQAELDLRRLESLFDKGFATQEQVDTARTAFEVRKASKTATEARIQQQEMLLKEASDTLAKATTFAPIDGTITVVNSELGDRVVGTGQFEGTEIMRIANLENMEVRVDVSEADIVDVAIGDTAKVEIDAIPDTEFEGVVTEIANSAATENGNSQDQLTTFQVKVKLVNPSDQIRPGMTATADIETKTVTDVVRVPLQSVTVRPKDEVARQLGEEAKKPEGPPAEGANGDGPPRGRRDNLQRVVFVHEGDKVRLVRVETGIADNRWIEIKSGVSADQEVVTGSYRVLSRELEHDMTVTVEEAKVGGFGGPRGD